MAVILKAGLDGIKNKFTPPAAVDRNIYVMTKEEREEEGIVDLPATLHEALETLQADEVIKEALRRTFIRKFHRSKRNRMGYVPYTSSSMGTRSILENVLRNSALDALALRVFYFLAIMNISKLVGLCSKQNLI